MTNVGTLKMTTAILRLSTDIKDYFLHESQNFSVPEDVSAYDGLELRVKGDGRRYKLILRTGPGWDTLGYTWSFDTLDGEWQTVILFSLLFFIFFVRVSQ